MGTPRIRIVSRHERLAGVVKRVRSEAEARGIRVSDRNYDLAVSIGGDGTMISAAVEGKPVMAVRGGRANRLIDIEPERVGEALDRLLAGRFRKERYSMLEVAHRKRKALAFNEAGITSVVPLPVGFTVSCLDAEFAASGDGIIVSTPQGSSGWSFSANGTQLHRSSNAFIISLLNPMMSPLRAVVIPQVPVDIVVNSKDHRDRTNLVCDGNIVAPLDDGARVSIRKSRREAVIYRFFGHGPAESMLGKKGD
jgi:NAD+ kinase